MPGVDTRVPILLGEEPCTVTNTGNVGVYYQDTSKGGTISPSVNDGTLTTGASIAFTTAHLLLGAAVGAQVSLTFPGPGSGGGGNVPNSTAVGQVVRSSNGSTWSAQADPVPVLYAEDYGTMQPGTFDNGPTINAAMVAAAALATGGSRYGAIVQLPAGEWQFTTPLLLHQPNAAAGFGGIWVRGAGVGLTILFCTAGSSFASPGFTVDATATLAKLSDFSLICQTPGTSASHGVLVQASSAAAFNQYGGDDETLARMFVGGFGGDGVNVSGFENRLVDVYCAQNVASGFNYSGTGGSDNFGVLLTADTNGTGFTVAAPNCKFSACKAFGSSSGSGWNISGQRGMYSSCEAQDNALYGFNDVNGDNTFAACVADTNGRAGGTNYGFFFHGNSSAAACFAINRTGSSQTYGYGGAANNGTIPLVQGTSRLPGTADVAPGAVGIFNVNQSAAGILLAPPPSGDTTGATDSAAIQALINKASTTGTYGTGVAVQLQPGIYYANLIIKPLVRLWGCGYGTTRIVAPATSTTAVIGSPTSATWMGGVEIAYMMLDGNQQNGATGRGLDFYNSAALPSGLQFDHDPMPMIHHIGVINTYDHGIALRWSGVGNSGCQTFLHDFFTYQCAMGPQTSLGYYPSGLYVSAPDSIISRGQVGASGWTAPETGQGAYGVNFDSGANGTISNVKAWYTLGTQFSFTNVGLQTQVSDCQSQDCQGSSALVLAGCHGLKITNFSSGGDKTVVHLTATTQADCIIDAHVMAADLSQLVALVEIDGTNCANNVITVSCDPGVMPATPIKLLSGALTTGQGNWVRIPHTGSIAPAIGLATLAAGTVSIADASITAGAIVRVSRLAAAGTLGELSVAVTAGTGFAINSSSATETSTVVYEILSY